MPPTGAARAQFTCFTSTKSTNTGTKGAGQPAAALRYAYATHALRIRYNSSACYAYATHALQLLCLLRIRYAYATTPLPAGECKPRQLRLRIRYACATTPLPAGECMPRKLRHTLRMRYACATTPLPAGECMPRKLRLPIKPLASTKVQMLTQKLAQKYTY
jgi:hypothetical protein